MPTNNTTKIDPIENIFSDLLQENSKKPLAKDPCSLWASRMCGDGNTKKSDQKSKMEKHYKDVITNLCGISYNAHTFIREKFKMMKRNPIHLKWIKEHMKDMSGPNYNYVPKLENYYGGFRKKSMAFFDACSYRGKTAIQAKATLAGVKLQCKDPETYKNKLNNIDNIVLDEYKLKDDFNWFIKQYSDLLDMFLSKRYNNIMPIICKNTCSKKTRRNKIKTITPLELAEKELKTINEKYDTLADEIDEFVENPSNYHRKVEMYAKLKNIKSIKDILRKKIKALENA